MNRDGLVALSTDFVKTKAEAIEDQVARLREAQLSSAGTNGVTVEAAVLNARSNEYGGATAMYTAEVLHEAIAQLGAKIDAFTAATNESSTKMTRWTFWMMVSSALLTLFTVAQIAIAVYAQLHPSNPQILFMR